MYSDYLQVMLNESQPMTSYWHHHYVIFPSGINDEIETLQKQVAVNKKEEQIAQKELHELLRGEIEQVKVDLGQQQKNETTEIAKHFYKMEQARKVTNDQIQANQDEVANIRGKVEIYKDLNEKITKNLGQLEDNLHRNKDSITKLENKIDQVRTALQGTRI